MGQMPNARRFEMANASEQALPWTPHQTVRCAVAASVVAWALIIGAIILLA